MIRLFNEDCMPAMKLMPDKAYDLAIVDPEYGINLKGPCGHFQQYGGLQKINNTPPTAEYFKELFRVSQNQIIWGGNYFSLPPCRCFIVWDKGESMYGRSFAECEMCWTSFDEVARILKMHPNQPYRTHPTQKPVRLYQWLLKNYAKPGDKILDTHGGSGSIMIACDIMGFDLDWYEIDADYFNAAKERLERHQRQGVLAL